jgi:tRNA wybutosine-synthesizing protein 3
MEFEYFRQRKKAQTSSNGEYYQQGSDASKKGSIDSEVLPLLSLINVHSEYLSTSSCSGRTVIWLDIPTVRTSQDSTQDSCQKPSGQWLFVSHDATGFIFPDWKSSVEDQLSRLSVLPKLTVNETSPTLGIVYLKMEPLILHIEASSIKSAQKLVQIALQAGYRNSGITLTDKRCIVAIRSTLKLDVPIASIDIKSTEKHHIEWLVTDEYLSKLTTIAQEKMAINSLQRQRLYNDVQKKI